MATSAIAISTLTPKNGPRQLMLPSRPPTTGPSAMPMPSAASYRMIAPAKPPDAEATIVARLVAMNSALPRPQPARKPTMPPMEPDRPASAAKTTMMISPAMSVFFAPRRLETQPGDEHRDRGDDEVAREQQLDLGRRRVQLAGEALQDRVDQADAHEGHDAGERDGPDGARLAERVIGWVLVRHGFLLQWCWPLPRGGHGGEVPERGQRGVERRLVRGVEQREALRDAEGALLAVLGAGARARLR